jgi:Flp pilus assembly protein TadG
VTVTALLHAQFRDLSEIRPSRPDYSHRREQQMTSSGQHRDGASERFPRGRGTIGADGSAGGSGGGGAGAGGGGGTGGGGASGDRGSLTLMLIIMFVSLLALAGLVIDGGAQLDAASNASSIAQEAARAGADQVNQSAAYASGTFEVNPAEAVAAANAYLATARTDLSVTEFNGTVTVIGPRTIRVTVTVREPAKVLSLIGINWISASESATATLVTGVTGPGT